MTREQFEQSYAEANGITVEELHRRGLLAIPCQCNKKPGDQLHYCSNHGWQIGTMEDIVGPDADIDWSTWTSAWMAVA